ncbi:FAD-dependent monooxygenase [Salinispora arenicola]|uniref:FAD-dependent oxidoreductase n=1 Tax=Salinispora arenicola TaxID=168697 RepID=A0A542XGX5_SALAC|nr:FAD-dependent monooxygenase [Salinispora arenicola]MCN0153566.1 FAD-dependent monooxygenase [Salinispora arenicola]MCN0180075.1 FAD-dependent monooxygenase [Salinispora arenicola]TQL35078.1 2-polyprenyl-6-methoxyphenol hydroxylase-like FAD-dependent oxidoreductase [Salinispora arenicola]GIM83152.1 FAD-dependent oxidoreductase [Salinispora arenicola]
MKALICGAGIAGLALAHRLHHHGWEVQVVDHAPGPREQGYMIDFFGPGYEALTAMGLRPGLRRFASSVESFRYIDSRGRTTVSVDYTLFARALDGEIASIMRPALERMLRESLNNQVDIRYDVTIDRISGDRAELSDGTAVEADVIVGADGIHSHVRSLVFGPERDHLRYLGMHTGAYVFHDPAVFEQVRGQFVLTETLNRQLGLYGLDDGRVAVFAVHRTEDARLPEDPREALRRTYTGMGDLVERAVANCPPPDAVYYDQVAQIDAPRWTDGRVALVGDAAYAVSLIAGQGASLGVAGAYLLAERLHAATSVQGGLTDYERRWRPVIRATQQAARDRVTEWFLPTSSARLLARRWGFRAMRLPGLDRLLVGPLFPKNHRNIAELAR